MRFADISFNSFWVVPAELEASEDEEDRLLEGLASQSWGHLVVA